MTPAQLIACRDLASRYAAMAEACPGRAAHYRKLAAKAPAPIDAEQARQFEQACIERGIRDLD